MSIKKIPVTIDVPGNPEPISVKQLIATNRLLDYPDHFCSLGEMVPVGKPGRLVVYELTEEMTHLPQIFAHAAGITISSAAQAQHETLIANGLTMNLWQCLHILEHDVRNRDSGLLNRSFCDQLEGHHLNLLPVNCEERKIVCVATIQVAPRKKSQQSKRLGRKFNLLNHELSNPDIFLPGSRVLLFERATS